MFDDGYRLSFSIASNGYNIIDNLSGRTIINVRGNFTAFSLDKDVALVHLANVQEAILTYKTNVPLFKQPKAISAGDVLTIREEGHYKWSICLNGKGAILDNGKFIQSPGFDADEFLRIINKTSADLMLHQVPLNPKRDIVRRIADAELLVWVYNGHTVVVHDYNVSGNYMIDCLIDGNYFHVILVSTSRELGVTTLFNTELEEIVSFPTDESIRIFYPEDEVAFDDC